MSQGSQGPRKAEVPKANDTLKLNQRQNKNYVQGNVNKAVFEMKPKETKGNEQELFKHKNQGKVPNYLNKYAKEREDKKAREEYEQEMAKHPPGTRLMPEEERVQTLNDLKEAKVAANKELEKLPVVAHSGKMERHKKELEEKLGRLDKAIETFSKKTVYVAM